MADLDDLVVGPDAAEMAWAYAPDDIRPVDLPVLARFGIPGAWRWRNAGERLAFGDLVDFPWESAPSDRPSPWYACVKGGHVFRGIGHEEFGYEVMADEEQDAMTPLLPGETRDPGPR